MTDPIRIFDDVLPDPLAYRARALRQRFETVHDGPVTFQGMAACADPTIPIKLVTNYPQLTPTLSFFRRSPQGQQEPHYLHDDRSMGDWTSIYYLSPDPPVGDGTAFYKNRATGEVSAGTVPGSDEWKQEALAWFDLSQWEQWAFADAKFNRLVLFPASFFHSRGLVDNYGEGDMSRLIQVCFGTGEYWL